MASPLFRKPSAVADTVEENKKIAFLYVQIPKNVLQYTQVTSTPDNALKQKREGNRQLWNIQTYPTTILQHSFCSCC